MTSPAFLQQLDAFVMDAGRYPIWLLVKSHQDFVRQLNKLASRVIHGISIGESAGTLLRLRDAMNNIDEKTFLSALEELRKILPPEATKNWPAVFEKIRKRLVKFGPIVVEMRRARLTTTKKEQHERDNKLMASTGVIYLLEYLVAAYIILSGQSDSVTRHDLIEAEQTTALGFQAQGLKPALRDDSIMVNLLLRMYNLEVQEELTRDYYAFKEAVVKAGDETGIFKAIQRYLLSNIIQFKRMGITKLSPIFPKQYDVSTMTELEELLQGS